LIGFNLAPPAKRAERGIIFQHKSAAGLFKIKGLFAASF